MAVADETTFRYVGQSIPRLDGGEKVRGLTEYADDIRIPGAWYGCVVRSPVSHGRLKAVSFDPAFDWNRVCVVTSNTPKRIAPLRLVYSVDESLRSLKDQFHRGDEEVGGEEAGQDGHR